MDLLTRIRQCYKALSKSHKRIAEYVLENYDKVAFMTAAELGRAVHISESTVVRFAGALGYSGYPELQKAFQESVRTRLTTVQRFERSKDHRDAQHLSKVLMDDIENIRQTLEQFDQGLVDRFIDEILHAKRVYILGLRSSSVLASYLGFYLNFMLPQTHIIQEGAQDVYDQLLNLTSEDVLIALSFPRYSKRTYDCVDYAMRHGIPILGITDGIHSPLFERAKYCLTAKYSMSSFVDSFTAPMSLINALIIGISYRKEGVEANLEKLEAIWEAYGIYGL